MFVAAEKTATKISSEVLFTVINAEKNNKGARFTVKSKSGTEFTYSISRSEFKGRWFTWVSVETRYMKFKRLGYYFGGNLWAKGKRVDSPSAVAIAWLLGKVEKKIFASIDGVIELYHTGFCVRCGLELTDSKSIERGLGPTCAKLK